MAKEPWTSHFVGENFTWSNNCDLQSLSRIDRDLLSPEWEEQFLDVSQRKLPKIIVDHFPLMLDISVSGGGSRYSKFENMWLKNQRA